MRIAWFMATSLENLILNNLPVGEKVQIMPFSRSKIGPKLEVREQPPWKSSLSHFLLSAISFFFFRHTWSMMSRTKLGVYKPVIRWALYWAYSTSVVELIKTLKSKKKGPIDKGKRKHAKARCCLRRAKFFLMKLLVWNVRGFNHPLKQKVVKRNKNLNISLVCILETRVKHNNMKEIIIKCFLDGDFFTIMIMLVMGEYGCYGKTFFR